MTSFSSMAGEEYSTLWTVLSSVDHASLWKTIMTLVVGRGGQRLNFCSIHLEKNQSRRMIMNFIPLFHSYTIAKIIIILTFNTREMLVHTLFLCRMILMLYKGKQIKTKVLQIDHSPRDHVYWYWSHVMD